MVPPLSSLLLVEPLLAGLNHVLKAEPALLLRAQAQAGKRIQLRAPPLPPQAVAVLHSGFIVPADARDAIDLVIDVQLVRAMFDKWSRASWLSHLQFSGDDALATLVRDAVQCANWDVEDELARLIGDIPAQRLSSAAASLRTGAADSVERIGRNISEYLTHERDVLVSSAHLATFADDLSSVEARLVALEARISSIEDKSHGM